MNAHPKPLPLSGSVAILLALLTGVELSGAIPAPPFELERWQSGEKVKLEDLAGQIVVLDFFAYWCLPCQRASDELEKNIQKYYTSRNGNPHGFPVRVVSVNVEKDHPEKTEAYIKKHACSFVLNDAGGKVLERYGGRGLPLIAVLDGTRAKTAGSSGLDLIYKHEGFEGVDKVRKLIDAIGKGSLKGFAEPPGGTPASASLFGQRVLVASLDGVTSLADAKPAGVSAVQTVEGNFETVFASDILLTQTGVAYGQTRGGNEWKLGFAHSTIDLDYRPVSFDFLGKPSDVSEDRNSGQLSIRQKILQPLTLLGSGGLYDGFTDYRSAWLSEYYRQQFSALPGYETAHPNGQNVSFGARWEYLPSAGFLQLNAAYLRDEVAPGYEIDFDGLRRSRGALYTSSYSAAAENILTKRIRLLNEFRLSDTTGRENRYSYQGSVNFALGERWVVRTLGGYSQERPTFEAWYVGSSLEFELTPSCLVSLSSRYYTDTGEIENSLFSNAAPGVETYQTGLGIRYVWTRSSLKLYVAPYFTSYEPFGLGTAFFQGLYKDRDWGILQVAYAIQF